ncbi:leucine zipper putative tumor suppressor 2 homolog isoform X1 [Physella acuta]|uniref:leucine zipper putative tumor suppressor 2 homolog isoform X1 n=1 Tax=Physella acuta TaxID=109671 RepID=UPI0027DD9E36|nr:leucine zipper putative tumor suppressor 2 homolog isoform X1 [Physella acuta]XP_059161627.1 leucine zipper putative tumor suppressor 2 homolog isoform X1 [Physella acuta]XP_059161628.1 leucine zipper putative tumor suppressor 2 homolog isoform X1 [Physella acuta]XP_059161630.1 leucine zipper putative tumor suppressor 2 homolog isoform X1 [Physella acuta]
MSLVVEGGINLAMGETESREVYSPASSYSTFSHEVKYIFDPEEDSQDQYADYSHITPRAKQGYLSYTPRTLSATSPMSGKENQTPLAMREEQEPLQANSRTNSVISSGSRDRGPISPRMEEVLYSSTNYGYGQRKSAPHPEHAPREKAYFSPVTEAPSYPYAKQAYPGWKNNSNKINSHNNNNNKVNNNNLPQYQQGMHQKNSNYHQEQSKQNWSGGAAPVNTFQTHHPLNNLHSNYHYHQPHPHNQPNHEPPYPLPPRYNHQHHMRRKTWSPPTLKMSLLNAGSQGSRVCYSNDSIDFTEEPGVERKSQSFSEDLDVTPPKLAPISGVLAQKPGPNLIKPIAFKPVQVSPVGQSNRRTSGLDEHLASSQEMTRPNAMKLGVSMLGVRSSPDSQTSKTNPGAFNSMAKSQHHASPGQQGHHASPGQQGHHYGPDHHYPTSHPSSVNSSHSGSQHNSSSGSYHNISSNSYSNIPANSQHNMSANSSHLSANSSHLSSAEDTSFSNELTRASDRPESVPSINTSRVSSHTVEGVLQTPSPSDSGVGELEAILREKDAEINTLREVMDRNERAIFQVYEERRHVWLQDTQELRDEYERKLKIQSRKSYKTEQVLSLQVYKLQQEQKTLLEENQKITNEKELLRQQVEENQSEIQELQSKVAALEAAGASTLTKSGSSSSSSLENQSLMEELALKNKELITLKSQLHNFEADMEKKNKEVAEKVRDVASKSEQLKSLKDELTRLKNPPVFLEASTQTHVPSEVAPLENMKPTMLGERDRTINSLQEELQEIKAQVSALKQEHEKEREQWLDEKNKVVRYQKQLQLNYVQMQRKNSALETEVQQLTLELENRDMKLIALDEESMC